MDTYAVLVDIGQRLEVFHAFHLVLHLHLSELAESGLLEGLATVLAAPIVKNEKQITFLGHIGLPRTGTVVPTCVDIVSVRASVDIHHCGIFLRWVEADGFHHAPVEVGYAVGGL